jgi:hypothetical protein
MKKANDRYAAHAEEMREAEAIARQIDNEIRIRAENETFAKMTPAQKRVRIARDVLDWIKLGRLVATNGDYISLRDPRNTYRSAPTVNGFECHACALGSIFAVAVERELTKPPGRNIGATWDSDMRELLEPHFDRLQLLMIEDAFEGFSSSTNEEAELFCSDIPKYIDGAKDPNAARLRMERIMRNIIANGGEFKP